MRYFEILAATAYKEFAHSLSNKSLQRLKDAGLNIGEAAVEKAQKKLLEKYNLDVLYNQAKIGYMPNKTERIKMTDMVRASGVLNDRLSGKILINNKKYNNMGNYTKNMVLYHEGLEKHYMPNVSKNTYNGLGHVNAGVLLQERRLYNQAGIKDAEYIAARKGTGEFQYIGKKIVPDDNGRVRSRAYKRALRIAQKELDNNSVNYRFKINKSIQKNKEHAEGVQQIYNTIDLAAKRNGLGGAINYLTKKNKMEEVEHSLVESARRAAMTTYPKISSYLDKKSKLVERYYHDINKTRGDLEAMDVYARREYI